MSRCLAARRGSVYLIVLSTAIIVTVIGVTGIIASGLQLKQASALDDVAQARYLAISALNVAIELVEEDPEWRWSHRLMGWVTPLELAGGSMSWKFVDDDGDLEDDNGDPMTLHVRGQCGQIVRTYSLGLEFEPPPVMIPNGGVEDGLAGWSVEGSDAVLQLRTDIVHTGAQAVLATSRANNKATPRAAIDVPLEDNHDYVAEAWIKLPSGTTRARVWLSYKTRRLSDHLNITNYTEYGSWIDVDSGDWTLLTAALTPNWNPNTSELISASMFVETDNVFDIVVDDYSLTPVVVPMTPPVMSPGAWRQEID